MHRLKCDRLHPCTSCSKRGPEDATACNYSSDGKSNHKWASRNSVVKGSSTSEAQIRLQILEDMVTGLVHSTQQDATGNNLNSQSSQSATCTTVDSSASSTTLGHLDINGSETKYHGATSWTSILESVSIVFLEALRAT
jgi:hypothetical protein